MRYQIIGEDRSSGGRRELFVEAASRAEAEKLAGEGGIKVRRVQEVREDVEGPLGNTKSKPRDRVAEIALALLLLAALALFAVRWLWPGLLGV